MGIGVALDMVADGEEGGELGSTCFEVQSISVHYVSFDNIEQLRRALLGSAFCEQRILSNRVCCDAVSAQRGVVQREIFIEPHFGLPFAVEADDFVIRLQGSIE